jgi:hypothetical protein
MRRLCLQAADVCAAVPRVLGLLLCPGMYIWVLAAPLAVLCCVVAPTLCWLPDILVPVLGDLEVLLPPLGSLASPPAVLGSAGSLHHPGVA